MNLNKFIQIKIFSRLIILYGAMLTCFLAISYYGVEKETRRYFNMTNGYIVSSTQQLINEGEKIRVQLNLDQFLKKINDNSDFKICPQIYLDNLLVANLECTGIFSKKISSTQVLNNSKKLVVNLVIDYDLFILSVLAKILFFSLFSFIAFIFIKLSIDHFTTEITNPLLRWSKWAQEISFNRDITLPHFTDNELSIQEFKNFNEFTQKAFHLQKDFYTLKINDERSQAIADLAKQVSHDIRSPLTALKMSIEDTSNFSQEQREMIKYSFQRINDIANNLLNYEKKKFEDTSLKTEHLPPIIDSIVSEKRLNFLDKINISIVAELESSYGLFSLINSTELKRVLSNLINNSYEAIEKEGEIVVQVKQLDTEYIVINIIDNGKGIPDFILQKLGEKKISYGKDNSESGHGLGLYHAIKTIETLGGIFSINSQINKGTTVSIKLKKAISPPWFIEELIILEGKKVLILDDDQSIHSVWSERFSVNVELFSTIEAFNERIINLKDNNFLALIDYELTGQISNGLEVIKQLKIEKNSVLVTSYFDERIVLESCIKYNISLIPKTLIPLVPIKHIMHDQQGVFQYVYIDDDMFFTKVWKRRAKIKNINLLTLNSIDEFNEFIKQIDKEKTLIYIDSDLGKSQMRGEDFAKILHERGFKNLFISTGYDALHFAHLEWLNYSGKECPF